MSIIIAPLKWLDKENGNTYWVPIYCGFFPAGKYRYHIDRGTNCKVPAGSLLWISHHMRSCVKKLPVLAILASTGSIPRNTDEY